MLKREMCEAERLQRAAGVPGSPQSCRYGPGAIAESEGHTAARRGLEAVVDGGSGQAVPPPQKP